MRLTTIIALLIHSNAQATETATKGEVLCHDALTNVRAELTDVKAQLENETQFCNLMIKQRDGARDLALERNFDTFGYLKAGAVGAAVALIIKGIISR